MAQKTAVIIMHGIGEQIPMETLTSFVDTVWTSDDTLNDRDRPEPDTGASPRKYNASWSKPDGRNHSFELRRITTEQNRHGRRFDFFEYYWAHRMAGATLEQVKSWIFDLMWRNPFTRVPVGLHFAWSMLWLVAGIILGSWIYWYVTRDGDTEATLVQALGLLAGSGLLSIGTAKLVSYIGDVARYVKAKPENIAVRQQIRMDGVRLLEELLGVQPDGSLAKSDYERVIVVGHSLGTIIAYDILCHAFARHNTRISEGIPATLRQPARAEMEQLIEQSLADPNAAFPIERFRQLQDECRKEMLALGGFWTVTDFVTLGSPLTHAEFLMAQDYPALEEGKVRRIFATCPPTLEWDAKTGKKHFAYHSSALAAFGTGHDPQAPRIPHHAALFAYTRWTNIYSRHRGIILGDLISGPLCRAFGLSRGEGKAPACGILQHAVLPSPEGTPADKRHRIFTHTHYWNRKTAASKEGIPAHIARLREALRLGD